MNHSDATANTAPKGLEKFSYDDAIVRKFTLMMYIWGMVGFLVGLIAAVELVLPHAQVFFLERGLEGPANIIQSFMEIPYLQFGRIRPLHTNAVIFAFAGNAIFAAMYYSTQRLLKTRMASDLLSNLHFWGWQLIIVAAALTLPLGITQGKEYAELEWPIDIAIAVVWLGFFGTNFFLTLLRRRERHLYVAIWFYIATIVTVTILHVFNNIWVPLGISEGMVKSYPIYAGVQDAFMQWWYGHNAVAFFLTTPFLGMMYYFLPKAANRPVFSYRLSIIHFWSLVFIYIWAGPHHLHYSAIPTWAQTLGMVFSVMLWMPSWGGMLNGLLTLRGAWNKVATDPVLKFFVVGITFYGMATFEGPLLSIKAVNSLSHFTDWTIAHVHAGGLGWNGMMAFGLMYWLLPRIFQTGKLYSVKLANTHFWLATFGILLYIVPIYIAGLTQGLMWREFDSTGMLVMKEFVDTIQNIMPMYYLRIIGGLLFMGGAAVGGINLWKTWRMRPAEYAIEEHEAAPLQPMSSGFVEGVDTPRPEARIDGVVTSAKRLDVFNQMWWHRRWERMPFRFTIFVIISVAIASLFEIIPTFVIRSNVPTISTVTPYTGLELAGRDIYISEGCHNCHSQMIRPLLSDVVRFGDYTKAGEGIYDHPHLWSSRRIGPDIAREGKINPQVGWHTRHFWNPPAHIKGSIMPPYQHLYASEINWSAIPLRMKAVNMLHGGEAYSIEKIENAIIDAQKQAQELAVLLAEDTSAPLQEVLAEIRAKAGQDWRAEDNEIIALIAYMRRLGVDLYKTPAEPEE